MTDEEVEAHYGAAARAALAAFPLAVLAVSPVTVSENVTFHVRGLLAGADRVDAFVLARVQPPRALERITPFKKSVA